MKLTITTQQAQLAILQVTCPQDNDFSWTKHLPAYIQSIAKHQDTIEIEISKQLLSATYGYNPSLFAKKIKSHLLSFQYASGHQTANPDNIIIVLYRNQDKPARRYLDNNSLKHQIKKAMTEGLILEVPLDEIPPSYRCRPEQLRYQLKRESGILIKIKKLKTKWVITKSE